MEDGTLDMKAFAAGTTIFRAGSAPDYAYLISSGSVEIVSESGTTIDTLRRGDFFGEMALVDDNLRSASAVAREDTECAAFSPKEIQDSLDTDLLAYSLVRLLVKRLRRADSRRDNREEEGVLKAAQTNR